jgi:acid phosphatase type 7
LHRRNVRYPSPEVFANPLLLAPLLALATTVAGGCTNNGNVDGRLAAVGTGDLVAPPMGRRSPSQPGLCGETVFAPRGGELLLRRPYLQRVTASSATVVWTATADASAGALTVAARTPDGVPLALAQATIDAGAPLPRGALQWRATLDGLPPGSVACYEIRHRGELLLAGGSITTAPPAGTGARVRVLTIGDSGGGGADQRALLAQTATVPFDLMIHTGDIAYDDGTLDQFEQKFFQVYAPLLVHAPVFPSSGNHDYNTADAAAFRQVFVMPENGGPDGNERWYSFDWGDVHFVALDTERIGAVQAGWLDADLAANRLPWTVVYLHRPPYSSGDHGGDELVRRELGPLLEKHAVPLVLAGHDHHYERFHAKKGVTYVVTGGGGRGVRAAGSTADTAFAEAVIHLVALEIEGDTLTMHAIDGVGREFDSTVIQKRAVDSSTRTPSPGA